MALFSTGAGHAIAARMRGVRWLWILAAFLLVGWMARRLAHRTRSLPAQYAALGGYVLAKGLILVPLLDRADAVAPGAVASAAQFTTLGTLGLSAVVFSTRQDFSLLRGVLRWGGLLALGAIVLAVLGDVPLGAWFNIAVIGLAGGSILYDTDRLRRRFRKGRHVADALSLFAAVAMMFWHVLRLTTRTRR